MARGGSVQCTQYCCGSGSGLWWRWHGSGGIPSDRFRGCQSGSAYLQGGIRIYHCMPDVSLLAANYSPVTTPSWSSHYF